MAHVVVHGHFYQPPRENPWSDVVGRQPSAAPFRDWNQRITAECYRPNAWARIVDTDGNVVGIVNNFELMSFDLGPTLARWLDRHAPDVLARMVAADQIASTAVAHPYHHVILPLSAERDRRTELRWGRAEFRHRFGREPAGVWLPETAVDAPTLEDVAAGGFSFTILDPSQIVGDGPVGPGAYRWRGATGATVDLVVYEGSVSHDIAFGIDSMSSAELIERAVGSAGPAPLVCLATDGETFGHHHKFTERAVAYALAVEVPRQGHTTGSLERWLAAHRPERDVEVRRSAWSCVHGVERWRSDCGCSTGGEPGWSQAWRAPLRSALDAVREQAAAAFEELGVEVFVDPWAARDDYVEVLLDPGRWPAFADRHLRRGASHERAGALLEAQRHALAMYTSCGWFFADPAGLETILVLRHAACCLERIRDAGGRVSEEAVLDRLGDLRSNRAEEGDGATLWARRVRPGREEAVLEASLDAALEELEGADEDWFERHRNTLLAVVVADGALPDPLGARAAAVLGARLAAALGTVEHGGPLQDVASVVEHCHLLGLRPAYPELAERAGRALATVTRRGVERAEAAEVASMLALAGRGGFAVAAERAQEVVYEATRNGVSPVVADLGTLLRVTVGPRWTAPI